MSPEVDHSAHQQGWPADQFHPVYDSFTAWLDGEAPPTTATVKNRSNKPRRFHRRLPLRITVVE